MPNAETDPVGFWREIERLKSASDVIHHEGTVSHLVARYRASEDFQRLADSTRASYEVSLGRFEKSEAWGPLRVRDLTPAGVLAARDALKTTPHMANQMLAVGRTVWDWAIPLAMADSNPFDKVRDLEVADRGHVPWPRWVFQRVLEHAPEDLRRLAVLGRMTCQRESDLIRMSPAQRDRNGIWCRPKKTKKRRRSFFIPLSTTDALELDRWAETPLRFENSRWKAPIERYNSELYIYSPRGKPYTPDSLRARWGRWLVGTASGKVLCRHWKAWLAEQVTRYEWDIDPEDARGPTIHGLRGTGILARQADRYDVEQIANDVGMSTQMVEHYMRFKDQMEVADRGRLRVVKGTGP